MSDVHVRLHKDILWLLLDRQPLNALTPEMIEKLTTSLRKATTSPPHLIVITGVGERDFCAGVDLPDDSEKRREELLRGARNAEIAFDELRIHSIPTAAVVKGSAFGAGCELATLCDTVIARDDARFRLPAINAKIFPGVLSLRLPALIGREATTRYSASGKTLNAQEALQLGLVQQVIPARRFVLDTEEILVMLASQSQKQ